MWLDHFAALLRQGLDDVRAELEAGELEAAERSEPALAPFTLPELIDFVRRPSQTPVEQDVVWLAAVRCFRTRQARLWGPVLPHMLAPALIHDGYRLALANPWADPADILQQLVAESLAAARSIPLKDSSRWVQRRISREACHRVRRWLTRTAARRASTRGRRLPRPQPRPTTRRAGRWPTCWRPGRRPPTWSWSCAWALSASRRLRSRARRASR
jgi:hypothetical protein